MKVGVENDWFKYVRDIEEYLRFFIVSKVNFH